MKPNIQARKHFGFYKRRSTKVNSGRINGGARIWKQDSPPKLCRFSYREALMYHSSLTDAFNK